MLTVGVLPVKRFAAAKQRLSGAMEPEAKASLAEAMLGDTLEVLAGARRLDRVVVVTGEPRAARVAAGPGIESLEGGEDRGQSAAAAIGIERALELGAEMVALLPGDCPLLDAGELDDLLASAGTGVVIVPDRHGTGTNALLLSPPTAIAPSFGPGSRERHSRLAEEAGVEARVIAVDSLALDLDTPEDLKALLAALASTDRPAARTRAALGALLPEGSERGAAA